MLIILFQALAAASCFTSDAPLDPRYAPDHQNYLCMNYTRATPLPCKQAADSWTPFCAFLEYWEACPTGGLPHRNENRRRAANGTDECGEMGDVD